MVSIRSLHSETDDQNETLDVDSCGGFNVQT